MNFGAIWEKHKKFLTQVIGGFAAFLVLLVIAQGYQTDAEDGRGQVLAENENLRNDVSKLDVVYDRETKLEKVLAGQSTDLLGQLSIVENLRIKLPQEHDMVEFAAAKGEIYDKIFRGRASRSGLRFPPSTEVVFDVNANFDDQEWLDLYVQLDVLGRFLNATVDHRVASIESITPGSVDMELVPGSAELALYRYPVGVKLLSTYEALLKVIETFQKPESFLSIEVQSIEVAEGVGEGLLTIELTVVGVHLGPVREERKTRRSSGRFKR